MANIFDLLNIPQRAVAAALTEQEYSDPNAYVLKPAVEALDIENPKVRALAEFVAQTASDPLTYVGAGGALKVAKLYKKFKKVKALERKAAILRRMTGLKKKYPADFARRSANVRKEQEMIDALFNIERSIPIKK